MASFATRLGLPTGAVVKDTTGLTNYVTNLVDGYVAEKKEQEKINLAQRGVDMASLDYYRDKGYFDDNAQINEGIVEYRDEYMKMITPKKDGGQGLQPTSPEVQAYLGKATSELAKVSKRSEDWYTLANEIKEIDDPYIDKSRLYERLQAETDKPLFERTDITSEVLSSDEFFMAGSYLDEVIDNLSTSSHLSESSSNGIVSTYSTPYRNQFSQVDEEGNVVLDKEGALFNAVAKGDVDGFTSLTGMQMDPRFMRTINKMVEAREATEEGFKDKGISEKRKMVLGDMLGNYLTQNKELESQRAIPGYGKTPSRVNNQQLLKQWFTDATSGLMNGNIDAIRGIVGKEFSNPEIVTNPSSGTPMLRVDYTSVIDGFEETEPMFFDISSEESIQSSLAEIYNLGREANARFAPQVAPVATGVPAAEDNTGKIKIEY